MRKVIDADFVVVSGPRQGMTPALITWAAVMALLMAPLAASDYGGVSIPDWYLGLASPAGTCATACVIYRWQDIRSGYDWRFMRRLGRMFRLAANHLHGARRAHKLG